MPQIYRLTSTWLWAAVRLTQWGGNELTGTNIRWREKCMWRKCLNNKLDFSDFLFLCCQFLSGFTFISFRSVLSPLQRLTMSLTGSSLFLSLTWLLLCGTVHQSVVYPLTTEALYCFFITMLKAPVRCFIGLWNRLKEFSCLHVIYERQLEIRLIISVQQHDTFYSWWQWLIEVMF